jgi:esterase/lipase superfamily enzyme
MPTDFDIQVAIAALFMLQKQPKGRRRAMLQELVQLWQLRLGPGLADEVLGVWKKSSPSAATTLATLAKDIDPDSEAALRITDQLEELARLGIEGDPFADGPGLGDDLQVAIRTKASVEGPKTQLANGNLRVQRLNGRRLRPIADSEKPADLQLELAVQASVKAIGRAPEPVEQRGGAGYALLPVWFGTDRQNTAAAMEQARFGAQRSSSGVAYGMAMVSIPKTHRQGEIERPAKWWNAFGDDTEYAVSHIVIHSVETSSKDAWVGKLADEEPADGLLFIHGYNTSFDEAIWRTAQLAHDLNFPGQAFCFSWASVAKLRGYPDDEATIDWSTANLQDFLSTLCAELGLKKLHVIAHSMGNRAFLAVLEKWQQQQEGARISQIVLAAPDIDADRFRQISAVFNQFDQVTLYSSKRDRAIWLSRAAHGKPRAGDSDPPLVAPDLATVDVTKAGGGLLELAHSYFADVKAVFDDLICVINEGKKPHDRDWLQRVEPNGHYELV